MSLNIKIVFKSEIHRLSKLPASFAELQHYVSAVTGYSFLTVRYLDEENDEITIACDSDLFTAYASADSAGTKNLRLHLSLPSSSENTPSVSREASTRSFAPTPAKDENAGEEEKCCAMQIEPESEGEWVWKLHTCDGCGVKPIVGPRFHCAVCGDFDFCSECEVRTRHPHPFTKFLRPDKDRYICIDITPENMWEKYEEIKKLLLGTMPRCEVKEDVRLDGRDTGELEMRWNVRNAGDSVWPAGCRVEMVKGNISANFGEVPQLAPGQEAEVVGHCWTDGGELKGKWKIVNPQGVKMGRLRAKGKVCDGLYEKIGAMVEMGFRQEVAREALKANNGDLQKAILSLSYLV